MTSQVIFQYVISFSSTRFSVPDIYICTCCSIPTGSSADVLSSIQSVFGHGQCKDSRTICVDLLLLFLCYKNRVLLVLDIRHLLLSLSILMVLAVFFFT